MRCYRLVALVLFSWLTFPAMAQTPVVVDREQMEAQLAALKSQITKLEKEIVANPAINKKVGGALKQSNTAIQQIQGQLAGAPMAGDVAAVTQMFGSVIGQTYDLVRDLEGVDRPAATAPRAPNRPAGAPPAPPVVVVPASPAPPVVVVQPPPRAPAPVIVVQPPPAPAPPPVAAAPRLKPLDESAMNALYGAVDGESFTQNKMQVVESGTRGRSLTVAQVSRLAGQFSFENDRLELVRYLRPSISDMENSYQLYKAFTFASSKDELKEILESP